MSMSAKEAREKALCEEYTINGRSYRDLLASQDLAIAQASSKGKFRTLFYIHETVYDEFEPRMKAHYRELGYSFEPVGMIGGVMQKDEYICWL